MTSPDQLNCRVLVIDDEESVRDGFQTVLVPAPAGDDRLRAAANALFGEVPEPQPDAGRALRFEADFASSGSTGLEAFEAALEADRPYAVVFCDMRMPGMDGLETVERLRALDPRVEVVFVTAYSDYTLPAITERVGANVAYFVKPFVTDEVLQLATKLVLDYNRARQLEALTRTLANIQGAAEDLDALLQFLLREVCAWLDAPSAALLQRRNSDLDFRVGVGELGDAERAGRLARQLRDLDAELDGTHGIRQADGSVVLPVEGYGLVLAFPRAALTPDRRYVLSAFLHHAALAISNNDIQGRLIVSQRKAAVGEALVFLLHDMRGPLGNATMLLSLLKAGTLPWTQEVTLQRVDALLGSSLDMLQDVLDYTRGEMRADLAPVALHQVLAEDLEVWQVTMEMHQVELVVEIPPGLAALVEPRLLARAVWNLVRNASEASRSGARAPRIEVKAVRDEHEVVITVADNGPGIGADMASTLFEPHRTRGKKRGTGFGLAIVKEIAVAHGGRIEIAQTGDTGTVMALTVRAAPD